MSCQHTPAPCTMDPRFQRSSPWRSDTMTFIRSLALVIAGALLCSAQLDRGAITGTVTDSSGAVVPGAKIAIRNVGTNVKYQPATTGTGDSNPRNLPPRPYAPPP